MKKILVLLVLSVSLALTLNSCRRKYDEIGRDSIYYYYNGVEQDEVTCKYVMFGYNKYRNIEYYKRNDSLAMDFCISHKEGSSIKKDYLSFNISHYNGPGIYRLGTGTGTGNTCDLSHNSAISDDRSYLEILELDTVHKTVSALFECHFTLRYGSKIDLTQGRFYFDMGNDFQIISY